MSAFAPLVYTGAGSEATFELTMASDGTVEGEVSAAGEAYTSMGEDGLVGVGVNLSLGVVRPDEAGKPLYGGAINSIPVVDIVPSAEIVFGDYPRLNAEVNVEGDFFPLNIGSVGTEIAGVFDGRGIGGSLAPAFGY